MERYNHLNTWLKGIFSERVLKICVNGGFSCPNRDGKCGYGGCIFCTENGSGEHIKFKSIKEQILFHLNSYRGERANKFIVYFQNFSNTYDTIQNLKIKYDSALIDDRIIGLSIATRPDCINKEIVKLLKQYQQKLFVMVELGLQSSSDKTAQIINRGYKSKIFTKAVKILNKNEIPVVSHIMLGLPGETLKDLKQTIKFINKHKISGLKIHSTYIVKSTKLANWYKNGKYTPLTLDSYIQQAVYVLTHINPNVIIHRVSGDAPKDILIAPEWNLHKKWVLNGIEKYMTENNLCQGMFYESHKETFFNKY